MPGYAAPAERTVEPASRVPLLILTVMADAGLEPADTDPPVTAALRRELERLAAQLPGNPAPEVLGRGLLAWSSLGGLVGFEVFGQYNNTVDQRGAYLDHQLARLAAMLGLPDDR